MTPQEIKPTPPYPWFAKTRNLILITLGLFLILSTFTLIRTYNYYEIVTQHKLQDDRISANMFALILEEHFQRKVKTLESYAHSPSLIRAVQNKNIKITTAHLIDLCRSNPGIESVVVADRDGTLWAAQPVRPDVMGKNFAYRDWYQGVSRQWKPYISNASLRVTAEKDTAVHIAVPVFDGDEKVIGILIQTKRAATLAKTLARAPLAEGSSVTVTDRKGVILYSSRYAYEKTLTEYPFHGLLKDVKNGGAQAITVRDPLAAGAKRYILSAEVTGTGWRVSVDRDSRDIFSVSLGFFLHSTALVLLLFLLITMLFLYLRKRAMTQMTENALAIQKDLLAAETRFRELFDHMSSGVGIHEPVNDAEDFILLDMNAAGRKITHMPVDLIGKSVRARHPGLVESGLFTIYQQVWRTGIAMSLPALHYHDAYTDIWVENYVFKLPSGQIVVVFDDITERKLAEDKLRESEDKFRTMFDNAVAGKSITIPGGRLHVNKAFSDMLGYSQDEINQLRWQDITHPDDAALTQQAADRMLSGTDISTRFMKRFIHKDGSAVWVDLSTTLRRDEDGNPLYFMSTFVDISERKLAESQREAALLELYKLNEELDSRVTLRTAELSTKTAELERINKVFVDRELRMRELKMRIAELERKT